MTNVVEFWVQVSDIVAFDLVVDVLLKGCLDQERPGSEEQVVEGNVVIIKDTLSTESVGESKVDVRKSQYQVLVKEV